MFVVIPAHNEASGIAATIRSVREQTVAPAGMTVVVDNCTDETDDIARLCGAVTFTTTDNVHKKAGALNQFLAARLPELENDDVLLVMDADTRLAPRFIETASRLLAADPALGAVGGVFIGQNPGGWLEFAQANEYARYSRDVARHAGRVMVLTGTASALRVGALLEVAARRGRGLPGVPGEVYDTTALTEDNEMTLALKHARWKLVSPKECTVWTELMPTVADLHQQRLRWYRGAIENVFAYGWTRITARYWIQQVTILLSMLMLILLTFLTSIALLSGALRFSPWWAMVGVGFLLERIVTAWRSGNIKARLLSAALFPEFAYDLILQFSFLRAASHIIRGVDASWHHVTLTPKEIA